MVRVSGRGWKKVSAAAALTVSPGGRGARRRRVAQFFRLYDKDINGDRCADFLRGLLRNVRGPVTLVWDGLGAHRAPAVQRVLARARRVEVHRLPSYAPELNPVEGVWANGKEVKLRGVASADGDELDAEAFIALEDIGNDRRLLRSFFANTPLRVPGVTT